MTSDLNPREIDRVFPLSHVGNAKRLMHRWGHNLWFVPELGSSGRWLCWNGLHWEHDITGQARRWAVETIEHCIVHEWRLSKDADDATARQKWAKRSHNTGPLDSMLKEASTAPRASRNLEDFDNAPYLLNAANGTIDLRDGTLREPRREDMLTTALDVEYHEDAEAPTWQRFLETVQPDPERRDFLQRAVGYALVGNVADQSLMILYGFGANGKSTFLEAITKVLGDYAAHTEASTLVGRSNQHPEALARLVGKRMVVTMETEQNGTLREGVVKSITGGEPITARYMYGSSFEFEPEFTAFMAVNELPRITGSDRGIWRRLQPIPFEVTIGKADRDPDLPEKLEAEAEGILAWAVEGALKWQERRLTNDQPRAVIEALSEYRDSSDHVRRFLNETCEFGSDKYVTHADLYKCWKVWADDEGLKPGTSPKFGTRLSQHGIDRKRKRINGKQVRVRVGVALNDEGRSLIEPNDLAF